MTILKFQNIHLVSVIRYFIAYVRECVYGYACLKAFPSPKCYDDICTWSWAFLSIIAYHKWKEMHHKEFQFCVLGLPLISRIWQICITSYITHCDPSDVIWWRRYRSALVGVKACCLTAPIHFQDHGLLIYGTLWHPFHGYAMFTVILMISILKSFSVYTLEIAWNSELMLRQK